MAEGDYLNKRPSQDAIKESVRSTPLDSNALACEVHRFIVLHRQVIIVHSPHSKRKLRRIRSCVLVLRARKQVLLWSLLSFDLLTDHGLQSPRGSLDCPLVQIAADPS